MGACSTITISRSEAVQAILEAVFRADDETLAAIMDELFGGERPRLPSRYCLNNFQIGAKTDGDEPQ